MASTDRLIEIFNEAKARPAGPERDGVLAEACGDDAALKEQVLSLLQAHDAAGQFLKAGPALSPEMEAELARLKPEETGERIGPYKLREQIGEGGFGVVWVAEQQEPVRRTVALKIIKLGMDTLEVVARFEQERQALAMMDHPNIARVFDAGATEHGRPFFVMELVRGIKITEYCDQANLPTVERLALFIAVCQAVQHAHQKGIIHRDLKPSNILVTLHDGVPVPKVIDFGVAKATQGRLGEFSIYTRYQQMIGTPLYMSPEQAEMSGLDVDTRTDIYALGVLLYELLTGRTPFDADALMKAGHDEMRRIIREEEPARPSTALHTMAQEKLTSVAHHRASEPPKLIHAIHGDLDWIVMKTLEKDRARRYETASGLATDIQRHLSDEPVTARPPSNFYRFQKLARRNKLAFAAGAAIAAALLIGLCVATIALARERTARSRAEAAEATARKEGEKSSQVAAFLKEMLSGANPYASTARDRTLMREILDRTSERIDKDLEDQPEVQAELRNVMGEAYLLAGEPQKAERIHRGTLAMQQRLVGSETLVADALRNLAIALRHQGKYAEAETTIREALARQRTLRKGDHEAVADALRNLGAMLWSQGKLAEAETVAREALAMRRRLHGDEHGQVADSLEQLAVILSRGNQLVEAETTIREALAMEKKIVGDENISVASMIENLAEVVRKRGRPDEALPLQREALAMKEKLMGTHHPWTLAARKGLIRLLRDQREYAELEALLRKELIHARTPDPLVPTQAESRLGWLLNNLADVLHRRKALQEARAVAEEASALYERQPDWPAADRQGAFEVLAAVLTDLGDLDALETSHRTAVDNIRARVSADDPQLAFALAWLAHTLLITQRFAEAEPLARECLAIRVKQTPDDWTTFDARSMLAGSLLGQKKYTEAEPLLLPGYEGMMQREGRIPIKHRVRLRESLQRLVQFYEATGPSEKATEWKTKLAEFDRTESEKRAAEVIRVHEP